MNAQTRITNPLIDRANEARLATIKSLESAIRSSAPGTAVQVPEDLMLVSLRPTSLGFSERDLKHFTSFYATLAEKKMENWRYHNAKALRNPIKPLIEERDRSYSEIKAVRSMLTILTGELSRRESLKRQEAQALESQRAELEASAAEQAAEIETAEVEIAAIKLKIPTKVSHKPAVKRVEFKKTIKSSEASNPFEALKGEVTARSRESWQTRSIKKSEALALAGVTESELDSARLFAQKMGTDEVLETPTGVIRLKKAGAAVRYEYYGAA